MITETFLQIFLLVLSVIYIIKHSILFFKNFLSNEPKKYKINRIEAWLLALSITMLFTSIINVFI